MPESIQWVAVFPTGSRKTGKNVRLGDLIEEQTWTEGLQGLKKLFPRTLGIDGVPAITHSNNLTCAASALPLTRLRAGVQ
jgi:hypothetical protein